MTQLNIRPELLLLLTQVPWLPTADRINDAYSEPIRSVLKHIAFEFKNSSVGVVLDVAVPVPYLFEHETHPRETQYGTIQKVVARVFRLICIIAAAEGVQVEDTDGIDVRILLLDQPRKVSLESDSITKARSGTEFGPVISLLALAKSQRPWQRLFSIESPEGEDLLRQFVTARDSRVKISKVAGGTTRTEDRDSASVPTGESREGVHHHAIAVGGTWDHIHIGHKLLLTMFAFLLPARNHGENKPLNLTIGITGDELLKNKKHAEVLESWQRRQQSVSDFLKGIMDFRPPSEARIRSSEVTNPGPNGHVVDVQLEHNLTLKLVEIADPFGPTITDENLTALVLSGETRGGGKAVNEKRAERGWPPLQVFEVDVLDAAEEARDDSQMQEDFASKLSSTAIRQRLSEKRLKSKA